MTTSYNLFSTSVRLHPLPCKEGKGSGREGSRKRRRTSTSSRVVGFCEKSDSNGLFVEHRLQTSRTNRGGQVDASHGRKIDVGARVLAGEDGGKRSADISKKRNIPGR